ncbi:hypothetical protein BB561_003549 [Smittium simulii]|uniref:Uncharacterized protein n=1 Tax=Smittium simulii TaxID=133385 RepID=A0A2T9YKN6_9FUNG|nr:hypothetical protein BB561_003549 [Smittium simulii]
MPLHTGYSNDVFLTFGDSITEFGIDPSISGWVAQLATNYNRRLDLVHRGFSGYNTRWAKEILKDILPKTATLSDTENINHFKVDSNAELPFVCKLDNSNQAKVRFLTMFFGANDASFPENKQSVPLEEYKANLSEMIQMVTDPKSKYYSKYTKIILITPPVVCDIMWEKRLKEFGVNTQNRSNTCAKIYSDAATQVGKNHNVAVVNLWEAFNNRIQQLFDTDIDTSLNEDIVGYSLDKSSPTFGFDQLLSDGLHPNKAGNDLIIKEVMAAIEKNYPELCPENISFTIPLWHDIIQDLEETEHV